MLVDFIITIIEKMRKNNTRSINNNLDWLIIYYFYYSINNY